MPREIASFHSKPHATCGISESMKWIAIKRHIYEILYLLVFVDIP